MDICCSCKSTENLVKFEVFPDFYLFWCSKCLDEEVIEVDWLKNGF